MRQDLFITQYDGPKASIKWNNNKKMFDVQWFIEEIEPTKRN